MESFIFELNMSITKAARYFGFYFFFYFRSRPGMLLLVSK